MSRKKKRERRTAAHRGGRFLKRAAVIAAVLLILAGIYFFLTYRYSVHNISVEGNTRYTDEEISDMVFTNFLTYNTLYLKYFKTEGVLKDVPYIEHADVQVLSPDSVRIVVYEKALAGYIEYLGQYMYFDRDGVVVESTKDRLEGLPQVLGLNFGYVVLYERLPVDNDTVFSLILSITQLLEKYRLAADRIFFDAGYRIYLYFGSIEAELGSDDYIDEKLEQLVHILPELEGKRGILRMKDYTPLTRGVTFEER